MPRQPIQDQLHTLTYAEGALTCRVRLSARRRTLALRVDARGELVVNAPMRVTQGAVHGFVGKHLDWIRRRQDEARAALHGPRLESGASLPYLGGSIQLECASIAGPARTVLQGDVLHCVAPAGGHLSAIAAWYRAAAREALGARLALHAARLGRAMPNLRISNARTRWGSLSPKGVVSLNWRLIKASEAEIDYVICHELAHFRHRNHAPAFWREVETLYPAWATARRTLRENAPRYFAF